MARNAMLGEDVENEEFASCGDVDGVMSRDKKRLL